MLVKCKELADKFKSVGGMAKEELHNVMFGRGDVSEEELERMRKKLDNGELLLPDDILQTAVRGMLERDFLAFVENRGQFSVPNPDPRQGWVRVTRLPISPLDEKEYALYPRWQNSIATMHALGQKLCYVLLRYGGETMLYVGAVPMEPGVDSNEARSRLVQAINSQMPGIGLEAAKREDLMPLTNLACCGTVTGIPSIRKINEYGEYQTMDQIAMGLRDQYGEQNFAVVVVATPIPDDRIVEAMGSLEDIYTDIHALSQYTKTEGAQSGDTISLALTDGTSLGGSVGVDVGGSCTAGGGLGELVKADVSQHLDLSLGLSANRFATRTNVRGLNVSRSDTISKAYVNKSAMYCEEVIEKHLARMKAGRNMGFWKTGVYVLAGTDSNVQTVMGMLRAVYSGDDTYIEPIRPHLFSSKSQAVGVVRTFCHVPHSWEPVADVLGSDFEDYATPMTTEELSIATSLPRRDVPGLRLIRNASRFATNPPSIRRPEEGGYPVALGEVLDTGAKTNQRYVVDFNQLVRHALVAGTNGSGKSNTCKVLLQHALEKGIPFLVVEPSKDEYLNWALEHNERVGKQDIMVYAPGVFGEGMPHLGLNPFHPAVADGDVVNMLEHLDRLKSALLSNMAMYDVLPLIMEETLYATVEDHMDVEKTSLVRGHVQAKNQRKMVTPLDGPFVDDGTIKYPLVESLAQIAREIVEGRKYDKRVEDNLRAAIATRVKVLLLGWKKGLLNVERSTDYGQLFGKGNVVINLSHLADDKDKALVMSLLLIALWEYRESMYRSDEDYRRDAMHNELKHMTLIEEAHRLMPNVEVGVGGANESQHYASMMFSNMLSEIRAYGEGCVIVDQVPTRLIPDAVKNTNLKIVHRLVSSDDIDSVATSMMLRPDQKRVIGALQQGEAIVCSDFDDAAAWVKVDPSWVAEKSEKGD